MASFNEQILQNQRPNFFELLAQESMHEALRPAFQYICKVRLFFVTVAKVVGTIIDLIGNDNLPVLI